MDEAERSSGGLSPIKVFLALAALLIAGFTTYVLTRDTTTPPPQTTDQQPPASIPTEAESANAIEAFGPLTDLRVAAYENRDVSLIPGFLSTDSPLRSVVRGEIRTLLRKDLTFDASYNTLEVRVLQESPSEVILRHVARQNIRILDPAGKDVGKREGPVIRVIRWRLIMENGSWRIFNSKLVKDRPA